MVAAFCSILTFNGIAAGISAVTLAKVDLANGLGQTIPTQIQHGTIAIGRLFSRLREY